MEKIDTGLAKLDNCTNHTLIYSPPKSFTSQKPCNIKCHFHTCQLHPATDNDTIFTVIINLQDALKQKALFKNALWLWSDKGNYQLVKKIHILQSDKFNKMDMVSFAWKIS